MTMVLLSVLLGAVLGLRFTVLIVIPAAMIAFVLALVTSVLRESGLAETIFLVVAVEAALQVGYLCGVMVRYTISAARAPRREETKSRRVLPWSA
ncbi:MAG TPA: hypothetical protein VHA77_05670 [Xanthobacteraceae bacterium]|nr:hypothetical protein [Xanthobacteraceae bacterium]